MAEKRYLDAELAAEMITRQMSADILDFEDDNLYHACIEGLEIARDIVRYEAPRADVAPVICGQWEKTNDRICYKKRCSFCRSTVRVCIGECSEENDRANFCPVCGARMGCEKL